MTALASYMLRTKKRCITAQCTFDEKMPHIGGAHLLSEILTKSAGFFKFVGCTSVGERAVQQFGKNKKNKLTRSATWVLNNTYKSGVWIAETRLSRKWLRRLWVRRVSRISCLRLVRVRC